MAMAKLTIINLAEVICNQSRPVRLHVKAVEHQPYVQ